MVDDVILQPDLILQAPTAAVQLISPCLLVLSGSFLGGEFGNVAPPPNCKFFIWLAINNRCWTSDQLSKHGLPHQLACPFCDQHEETIYHLLTSCVLAREVWLQVLCSLNLTDVQPPSSSSSFNSWWKHAARSFPGKLRGGFNSLVIVVSWELRKHRNACVFEGNRTNVQAVLLSGSGEGRLWCLAGASRLQELIPRPALPSPI